MDRNVTVAVFFLFWIFADASNAKIRNLAVANPNDNSTNIPVSGANKPDSTPVEAGTEKKTEALDTPSQLDKGQSNKTDLVSPLPRNQTTDNSKDSNSVNSQVQNNTIDNLKDSNNTDDGKNFKTSNDADSTKGHLDKGKNIENSNDTDSTRSHPEKGKNTKNANGTDVNPAVEGTDNGKKQEDKRSSESGTDETCSGLPKRCRDGAKLVACIQSYDTESRVWTVLVQNEGENTLRVNLTVPTDPLKQLELSKQQTKKINISSTLGKDNKVVFKAGKEECVLHLNSLESEEKFILYLPSYDQLLTPINGAYFLVLSVLIFGGTWACCKFRKRRLHDGVPYQELEMGLPESVSATNVDTAEGWDQGWDDDWDDETAVKSPGGSHMGNISANGLISRTPNKDGWEHDWDE